MNQSRKDQRFQTSRSPRLRQSRGALLGHACDLLLPPSLRQLWRAQPASRSLNLEAFEDRLLFNAAPAPMPAPVVAEVVVVAPMEVAEATQRSISEAPHAAESMASAGLLAHEPGGVQQGDQPTEATLIVIDPSVSNYESLLDRLSSLHSGPTDILVLDLQKDGIEQITERLEQLGETRAIHILSHGDEAGLHLGSNWLSADTISLRGNSLAQWQSRLTVDADVLFYGCDLAANATGQAFLQTFGEMTGADVAASTNATGAADLGGDWNLEYQFGSVETRSLGEQVRLFDWEGVLTTNTYQQGVGGYFSGNDNFISAANPDTLSGSLTTVIVGGAGSNTGLLRFGSLFGSGVGQIPLGSTITSASLRLNVTVGTAVDSTIALHRVLAPTWNHRSSWNTLGDGLPRDGVDVAIVADALVSGTTTTGIKTITGIEETLQAWSDGAVNNGWALFGDNATDWAFTTLDGATVALRPMLIVDFIPPTTSVVELLNSKEVRVNSTTTNGHSTSVSARSSHDAVGVAADGSYVVVWTSDLGDGSGTGVYAQRYNARNVALGGEFLVNTQTNDNQRWASVAVKADSGFVVTWTSQNQDGDGQGIYAKVFSAAGVGGSEFRVSTTTTGTQQSPAIGVAADGKFVIAWEGNGSGDTQGIYAQRFDAAGAKLGGEISVNSLTTNRQNDPAIAVGQDGQFMVVWDDVVGTLGRRFTADGSAKDANDLLLHGDITSGNADVATNGTGDYHIVWRTSGNGDGSGRGIWRMSLDAAQNLPGTAYLVSTSTINDQTEPSVTSGVNGDFVVVWQGSGPGDTAGVFARKFTSAGVALGAEFQLNQTISGSQIGVSAAMLDTDNFVAVWSGNSLGDATGIAARTFGTLSNEAALVFTTEGNVSASGSTSLSNWTTGDMVSLGQSNLTLGSATSGTLSIAASLADFGNGNVKINGLDVVQHDVLVGSGVSTVQIRRGDILFSTSGNETFGTLNVTKNDIVVYRPDSSGNFADGTFFLAIKSLDALPGGKTQNIGDFDLIERDTQVGDVLLRAGDLVISNTDITDQAIVVLRPTSAGPDAVAGSVFTLLLASEFNLNQEIYGIQVIEQDTRIGGVQLRAGNLLVSTKQAATLGSNSLSVANNDVTRLIVNTTSVNGPASVTASVFVDGSDVALDTSAEAIHGLALNSLGTPPTAVDESYTLNANQSFDSNSTWFNSNWSSRTQLTFDNSSRAENLTDFPILVNLDSTRINYSLAKSNGADLRFVDANGTALAYEIETWNPSGRSAIWVKVPQIDASSSTDSIWMYYGNATAVDAQNAAAVWSNGYAGVWHLNNNPVGSQTIQDSTINNKDGSTINMDASNKINGPIGGALNFDGTSEAIRIASTSADSLAINGNQLTIEAWANSTGNTGLWKTIVNRRAVVVVPADSYGLITDDTDQTQLAYSAASATLPSTTGSVPNDRWRYFTATTSGTTSTLYVDGSQNATRSISLSVFSGADDVTIGAGENSDSSTLSEYWQGGLDEIRISNVARSAAWVSAQYASMTDTLVSFGARHTVAGLLSNESTVNAGGITVTEVDLSDFAGFATVVVQDNGRVLVTPGAGADALAAGQTVTKDITYTVTDSLGGTATATAHLVFTGVNDAPVMNTAVGPLSLTAVNEDDAAPTGHAIAVVIASGSGALISDVDSGSVAGIAVTGVDNTQGTWQYSSDNVTWTNFTTVSNTSATLLSATSGVRFTPAANFHGAAGAITFRAWDQTAGTNGQTGVSTSVNGGSSAFSVLTSSASILVNAVNDAPVISVNAGLTLVESGTGTLGSSKLASTDVDNSAAQLVYTVTTSAVNGRLERVAAPGTAITSFTQADLNSTAIRYVHNGGETTSDSFAFSLSDGAAAVTGSFAITVTPVNDAPVVTTNTGLTLNEGASALISNAQLASTDPDNSAAQRVYTLTASVTHGRLEKTTNAGVSITSFTQANLNSGVVRYVHDGGETTTDAFSYSLSDGSATVSGSFAIAVNPVNDAPVVTTNPGLTVLEGGTVTLSSAFLSTRDAETSASGLTYTVTNPLSFGYLALAATPGTAITAFTQGQIDANQIVYIHSGAESTADDFDFSVSDGALSTNGTQSFSITPVNDLPVFDTSRMTLTEGQSVTLSTYNLLTNDDDAPSSPLIYNVNAVTQGRFEFVSAPGTAITSFTQDDINNSQIRFVHDAGELEPTASLSVTDGTASVGPRSMLMTFSHVNDAPVMGTNTGVSVDEAATVTIGNFQLAAVDADNSSAQLVYAITTSPAHGRLEKASNPGVAITSLTQAEINGDLIRYVHDGSETTSDTFSFSTSDGTASATGSFAITVAAVNDAPRISKNTGLSLNEGGIAVIGISQLEAIDPDNTVSQLVYTITTNVTCGRLEVSSNPGVAISSFTQAKLNSGMIRYVHDGGETTSDAFVFSLTDGVDNVTGTFAISVTPVNDAPVLGAHTLVINEGQTVTLASTNFGASDSDSASLSFVVSGLTHGDFRNTVAHSSVTEFTLSEIQAGVITFIHDGGEVAPTAMISVSDGILSSPSQSVGFSYTPVNDSSVIVTNIGLTVDEGNAFAIGSSQLSALDPDNSSAQLIYSVSTSPTHGRLERLAAPGVSITSFTQADLADSAILYMHDGGESTSDAFEFSLSDGVAVTSGSFAITVTPINDAPVLTVSTITVNAGQTVTLGASDIWALDSDNANPTFTVSGITHGVFQHTQSGLAVTSFTRDDIASGVITFTHDGSNDAPVADVSVSDGVNGTSVVSVSFTFSGVNDLPTVDVNTGLVVQEGAGQVLSNLQLLASDVDNTDAQLVYTITSAPIHGILERVNAPGTAVVSFTQSDITNGRIRYVHDGSESVADSFEFALSDGGVGVSIQGAVAITVHPVDDSPVLTAFSLTIQEGGNVVVTSRDLDALDPDSSNLTFTVSDVGQGEFVNLSTGTRVTTFSQLEVQNGLIRFVHDGSESAPAALVSVADATTSTTSVAIQFAFTNANDSPVINPATFTIPENATLGGLVGQVQFVDPDIGDTQTFSLLSGPSSSYFSIDPLTGEIRVLNGGSFDFETLPTHDLQVQVTDAIGAVSQTTVRINLSNVNEAPVVLGIPVANGVEDLPIVSINLNSGWRDPELAALSFEIVSLSNAGLFASAVISPDGMLNLIGGANANGRCLIQVRASDPFGMSATTTIEVVLVAVNDAPVAYGDALSTALATDLVISPATLLANDLDIEHNPLSVVIKKQPRYGRVIANGDGTFTYRPTRGFTGADSFEYAVSDGTAQSASASVSLSVAALAPATSSAGTSTTSTTSSNSSDTSNTSGGRGTGTGTGTTVSMITLSPGGNGSTTGAAAANGGHKQDDSDSLAFLSQKNIDESDLQFEQRNRISTDDSAFQSRSRSANDASRFHGRSSSSRDHSNDTVGHEGQLAHFALPALTIPTNLQTILALNANQVAFANVTESLRADLSNELVFEVPALAGASLSVGYVVWMLRGGVLITSLLAQMPAWRIVDPLVILESLDQSDEDDESIGSLLEQGQSELEPAV